MALIQKLEINLTTFNFEIKIIFIKHLIDKGFSVNYEDNILKAEKIHIQFPGVSCKEIEIMCCAMCIKFETSDCPVLSAGPWSRHKNYCNEFKPVE